MTIEESDRRPEDKQQLLRQDGQAHLKYLFHIRYISYLPSLFKGPHFCVRLNLEKQQSEIILRPHNLFEDIVDGYTEISWKVCLRRTLIPDIDDAPDFLFHRRFPIEGRNCQRLREFK